MFKKNTAVTGFPIGHFIQTADGAAKITGTPACTRLLDGTAGSLTNAASYDGTAGVWKIDLAAEDTNGDMVGLVFSLADCIPISYAIRTSTKLVSDLNDAAAAPSAATNASAVRTELATELARINTPLSNIETDTQDIQGRLPAALVAGRMDSSVGEMAANVLTAAAIAQNAIDADALTDDAIDAILDEVVEGSVTMRQLLRGFAAVLLGKSTNSGADYRDLADSKTRVDSTLDGSGNRTAVTLDLT